MEWIIINVIESILLSWFISSLVDIKCKKWLYRFLLAAVNLSIITLSNYMNMYDLFLSTAVIITSTIISHFFTYNTWSELLLITTFEGAFSTITTCFTIFISLQWSQVNLSLINRMLYGLGTYIIIKNKNLEKRYLNKKVTYELILILYFIHYVLQQFLQLFIVIKSDLPEILITIVMMVLCIFVLILLFMEISKMNLAQEEYKRLKQEKKNEETLSYLYDQLKITKHDLKHDFDLLNYYIEINNFEKIKDFIVSKKAMIDHMPTLIQSNNKLLHTIINNKIIQAYAKNIQVECHIIVNEFINMVDYDLNELLSNILDNAIENCLTQGRIIIDIVQEDLFLHIRVKNDNDSKNFSKELITKKDKENHGFGLKSIKRIIDQYQGTYSIENNEKYYEIKITLLLK